jgi:hypothetical protein
MTPLTTKYIYVGANGADLTFYVAYGNTVLSKAIILGMSIIMSLLYLAYII